MLPTSSTQEEVQQLRSLVRSLSDASEEVIQSWLIDDALSSSFQDDSNSGSIPSNRLFEARRMLLGAAGMIIDMVQDPQARLMELAAQFYEVRALYIAVQAGIPDILAEDNEEEGCEKGVSLDALADRTGINAQKLGSILRCLCTAHVFSEVSPDTFANNHTSKCLVDNEPLQAWIIHAMGVLSYESSRKLPQVVLDPTRTYSQSHLKTAFQFAFDTPLSIWPPLYADYPWAELGDATVVDVGGGVGGMSLDLARKYPRLRFLIQDQPDVVTEARTVWQNQYHEALNAGRVQLMVHDFFTEQPFPGAEVYILRYILHDWNDKDCIKILRALRPALLTQPSTSRILICDQVLNTTFGSTTFPSLNAPPPLPANYGYASRFAHMRDLDMMGTVNGKERTTDELSVLAEKAGLRVEKIWVCRGLIWITELRLGEDEDEQDDLEEAQEDLESATEVDEGLEG